jgi:hypothetical protein
MSTECVQCAKISSIIGVVISFFCLLGMVIIPLANEGTFEEVQCTVIDVKTPDSITNRQPEDFIDCDCGKRCTSETACSRVYVSIEDGNQDILLEEHAIGWKSSGSRCTFKRGDCGETIEDMEYSIKEGQNNVAKYENYMKNNQSFTCYTQKKEKAYIGYEIDTGTIILLSILTGVFIIWCMCVFGCEWYENHKHKIKEQQKNEKSSEIV